MNRFVAVHECENMRRSLTIVCLLLPRKAMHTEVD